MQPKFKLSTAVIRRELQEYQEKLKALKLAMQELQQQTFSPDIHKEVRMIEKQISDCNRKIVQITNICKGYY